MKQALITTGINGLVGSKFAADFNSDYEIVSLDLRHPIHPTDITDFQSVYRAFTSSPAAIQAKAVIHLAAYTDVTGAWQQRDDKNGLAYQINVNGTANIVKACQETGKQLIHISTAYVFNGENTDLYSEEEPMRPIEWYGQTKAWAEEKITAAEQLKWTILRIDQPFRSDIFDENNPQAKKDVAHRIIDQLQRQCLPPQFGNHYFGPTFIDDFAKVLNFFIKTGETGLFHATSGEKWTDFDFANAINNNLKLNSTVKKGDLDQYLATLNRPYQKNTALNCDKLKKMLDFKLQTIESAIKQIKN